MCRVSWPSAEMGDTSTAAGCAAEDRAIETTAQDWGRHSLKRQPLPQPTAIPHEQQHSRARDGRQAQQNNKHWTTSSRRAAAVSIVCNRHCPFPKRGQRHEPIWQDYYATPRFSAVVLPQASNSLGFKPKRSQQQRNREPDQAASDCP